MLWETEKGETSSNPLYFKAKDADGRSANVELFMDDAIGSGEIPAGDKARGKVAFDIKPGTSTVIITNPVLQEVARISVTPTTDSFLRGPSCEPHPGSWTPD